jgi:TonB family protein
MKYHYVLCVLFLFSFQMLARQNDSTISTEEDSIAVEPKEIKRVVPDFPFLAQNASLEANILVEISVDKDGVPYKTEILEREPEFVYVFDDEVRKSAMQWRFSPALNKKGEPVKASIGIPFRFRMRDYEPPVLLEQATPEYPPEALEMGMEGWIGVGVLVNKDGGVLGDGRIAVVSREFPYTTIFDEAAIDAVRRSKFKPATNNGSAILGWLFYKVEFKIPQK